jgi:hypothetical protein
MGAQNGESRAGGRGSLFGCVNGCGGLDYGDYGVECSEDFSDIQAARALRRDFPFPPCELPFGHPGTLEVLETFNRERLTKRVYADGTVSSYGYPTYFIAHCVDVSTDDKLLALLQFLTRRWDCAIVHGRIRDGVDRDFMVRRLSKPPITFEDTPREVFGFDMENLTLQPGLDPFDLESCLAYMRSASLPAPFRDARIIGVATTGQCIEADIHFRAWVRFSRPMTCYEVKRWLQKTNARVDLSPMHPIGFAYTGTAIFDNPADDPLPNGRVVALDGDPVVIAPGSKSLKPKTYAPRKALRPRAHASGSGSSSGGGGIGRLIAAQELIEKSPGGPKPRHKVILEQCFGLMPFISTGLLDEQEAYEGILEASLSIGKGKSEVDNAFNYALRETKEDKPNDYTKKYDENDCEVQ